VPRQLKVFVDGHCENSGVPSSPSYECDYRFSKGAADTWTSVCPWWIKVYNLYLTAGIQASSRLAKAQSETEIRAAIINDIARITGVDADSVTLISFTQSGSTIAVVFSTTDSAPEAAIVSSLNQASFTATAAAAGTAFTASSVSVNTDAVLQGHASSAVNSGSSSTGNNDISAAASSACGAGCVGGIAAGLVVAIGAVVVIVHRNFGKKDNAPDNVSEDATSNVPMKEQQQKKRSSVENTSAPDAVTTIEHETAPDTQQSSGIVKVDTAPF
jgi:hypothetical protein